MNKSEFLQLVQKNGNYKTKADAETAVKAFTDAITTLLVAKDEISLVGFDSFSTALQKSKSGKVLGTDRTYTTEDKTVPKFKAGKNLKEKVAKG